MRSLLLFLTPLDCRLADYFNAVCGFMPCTGPRSRWVEIADLRQEFRANVIAPFRILEFVEGCEMTPSSCGEVSLPQKRNYFTTSAMNVIGGGEKRMLDSMCSVERRGGGLDDGVKIVRLHDSEPSPAILKKPIEWYATRLGLSRGCVRANLLSQVDAFMRQNLDSNPGPTYVTLGFKKKGESLLVAWDVARRLYDMAEHKPIVGVCKPVYSLAGRSKLSTAEKFDEKIRAREPLGRAVWMADHHESIISGLFSEPMLSHFRQFNGPIQLGFDKFGVGPTKLAAKLSGYNTYFTLDYKGFDYHVLRDMLRYAFDLVRYAYDSPRGCASRDDHLLSWIEDEITDTLVVWPDGRVVCVHQGIPSGSGFTALLGSIINFLMASDGLLHVGVTDAAIFCSGDDGVIGMVLGGHQNRRIKVAKLILARMASYIRDNLGGRLSPEKSSVGCDLYVAYIQPNVPRHILDGSSKVIHDFNQEMEYALGRKLTFEERWRYLDHEPGEGGAPGLTHRWSYLFKGRVSFLSHFLVDKRGGVGFIRPTHDVFERLLCPESPVRDIDDHISRLCSALVDNFTNEHVVNHIMHHYFDAWLIKRAGITSARDLLRYDRFGARAFLHPGVNMEFLRMRAWYRNVDRVVDPRDFHPEFWKDWTEFSNRARLVQSTCYNESGPDWIAIRRARRGLITGPATVGGTYDVLSGSGVLGSLELLCRHLAPYPIGLWLADQVQIARGIGAKLVSTTVGKPLHINDELVLLVRESLHEMRVEQRSYKLDLALSL